MGEYSIVMHFLSGYAALIDYAAKDNLVYNKSLCGSILLEPGDLATMYKSKVTCPKCKLELARQGL